MLPLTSGGGVCQKRCQSCDQTWFCLFASQTLALQVVLNKKGTQDRSSLKNKNFPYLLV